MYQILDFPPINCKYKQVKNNVYIFDRIRKKYVFLSPEEWVRQHLIHFLIDDRKFPGALIKIESGLRYNELLKRSDVIVFDRNGNRLLIIECKSAEHKLNANDMGQLSAYGNSLKPAYLGLSNGLIHMFWKVDYKLNTTEKIRGFPFFDELAEKIN
jgi:hypothetical protein